MSAVLSVAGLVAIGALTPGPNNILVLDRALRHGMGRTVPLIGAIVAGSLTQVVLAWHGMDLLAALPGSVPVLVIAGAAYLAWLGAALMARAGSGRAVRLPRAPRWKGIWLLQFANPKGWLMVLTAVGTVQEAHTPAGLGILLLLFFALPSLCLAGWASAGAFSATLLSNERARRGIDIVMGGCLIALAADLMAAAVRPLLAAG